MNLLLHRRRSVGALRRGISRAIVGILGTLILSSLLTVAARSGVRSLQRQTSVDTGLVSVSLSSQFAACSAERTSLKGIVATAQENSTSRRVPHVILEVVARALPSEMWVEKISINGAELEIVGVAPRADDVERLVSSQEFVRTIVGVRIVSTHTDMRNGRQVFQLSAQAPPSLARGAQPGFAYAF